MKQLTFALRQSRIADPLLSPEETGEGVAQGAVSDSKEPICWCGCDRFIGACVWDPSPERSRRLAATVARIEQELRSGTGRFAC